MSNHWVSEAGLWIAQSQLDWDTAHELAESRPYVSCFYAQQAAEKALKSVYVVEGLEMPRIHSIGGLLSGLMDQFSQFEPFRDVAAILDAYYIGTRYPSAELGQVPGKNYTMKNANDAVTAAKGIVDACQSIFGAAAQEQH